MVFRRLFADQPLKTSRLQSFRAEHFPYSGPYPWLDRDDALDQVESRLQRLEISSDEAELCRQWAANGYVIIDKLFDSQTLDGIWTAYEKAIASGRITLVAESAGEDDPYPGRFLNPHKKIGAFCRILKAPGLLHLARLLIGREPRTLQTIAAHKGSQQGLHSDSIHMTRIRSATCSRHGSRSKTSTPIRDHSYIIRAATASPTFSATTSASPKRRLRKKATRPITPGTNPIYVNWWKSMA